MYKPYKPKKWRNYYERKRKRSRILRSILVLAFALIVVFIGYSASGPIIEYFKNPGSFVSSEDTSPQESQPEENSEPVTSAPQEENKPSKLCAVYMPASEMSGEKADRFIDSVKSSQINAVVIQMKNQAGEVNYPSDVSGVTLNKSTQIDARATANRLKQSGITPIAEIYCFIDSCSPYVNIETAIMLSGGGSYRWLDNSPDKGGKPWLNPYSKAATDYLCALIKELSQLGYDYVLLNGVQFPPKNMTRRADFGPESHTKPKSQALIDFIEQAEAIAQENNSKIILSMSSAAALGIDTTDYDGNPLDFGAKISAPVLMPSQIPKKLTNGQLVIENPVSDPYGAVKMAAGQLLAKVKLGESKTALMPWLQAHNISKEDMVLQLKALKDSGIDSFIFYNPDGKYDFEIFK